MSNRVTHTMKPPHPSIAPVTAGPRVISRRSLVWLGALIAGAALVAAFAQSPVPPAANAPAAALPAHLAKATLAGGCFWCVEADFDKVPGVVSTTSGYIGGTVPNPGYPAVSSGRTGHAEAVEIVFDPAVVTYRELVDRFWRTIDPTVKNRQFCDSGTPYRTAIFAHGPEQLKTANESRAALDKTKPFAAPIVTEILAAGPFYPAEAYHQDYHTKNPARYRYYRTSCGRDARLAELWGPATATAK
jgi:peptide-methionine (S)-S-oxide reductase